MKNNIAVSKITRKIGVTSSSISGQISFNENIIQFESTLERDFILRTQTIKNVRSITSQPMTIEYFSDGKLRKYTPDFLIEYKGYPYEYKKPVIIEVKPHSKLQSSIVNERNKYRAMFRYCSQEGYIFHFKDELRIRDTRWRNAVFLNRYKKLEVRQNWVTSILEAVELIGSVRIDHLIERSYVSEKNKWAYLNQIWQMVGIGILECDMNKLLNESADVWVSDHE